MNHSGKKMCRRSKWIPEKEQALKINYMAWSITIKRKGQQEETLIMTRLRHPSPVCTVCTEENHCRSTHSLPHLITHSNWKQQDSKNEHSPDLMDGNGTSKMLDTCSSLVVEACNFLRFAIVCIFWFCLIQLRKNGKTECPKHLAWTSIAQRDVSLGGGGVPTSDQ